MAQSRPSELPPASAMLGSVFGCHTSDQRLAASRGLMDSQAARAQLQRFSQSSDEVAAQMQQHVRQLYLQAKDRSSLANSTNGSSGETMETDGAPRQQEHPGSPVLLGGALNMQASAGLMRYHSAPSSMLSSLVDMSDEFFSTGPNSLNQVVVDSEFAPFFRDDPAPPAATQFESKRLSPQTDKSRGFVNNGGGGGLEAEQRRLDSGRSISHHSRFKRATANGIVEEPSRVPLSAILEHAPEVNSDNFCGHSQILLSCSQQGARTGLTVGMGSLVSDGGSTGFPSPPESKSNLIRHSSSPAGLLSRLAMEVQNENIERSNPCFSGPLMHPTSECLPDRTSAARAASLVSSFPMSCFGAGGAPPETSDDLVTSGRLGVASANKSGLLRHSSSPAGLLSQLNLDGLADGEKLMLPSSSGNSSEEGSVDRRAAFLGNYPLDDSVGNVMVGSPNGASFAARKRIRELGDKYFSTCALTDSQQREVLEHRASLASQFNLQTATSPENPYSPDKLSSDSAACRARAKRGCATHPRSIAERVRRMKISERMRKLQELVPNMDKQTNTADMLDEAVEYVKFLQRQVQELTENGQKCNCTCNQKATTSK